MAFRPLLAPFADSRTTQPLAHLPAHDMSDTPAMPALGFQRTRAQFPFFAVSRNGENSIWTYELEPESGPDGDRWIVRARPAHPEYDGVDWYEVEIQAEGESDARVITANNGLAPGFAGRGVAPALYPLLARRLGRRLLSSRARGVNSAEFRSQRIDEVWTYLRASGAAEYDGENDQYIIDGRNAAPTGQPSALEAAPTTESEFQAFMERIDATLRAEGRPAVGRELGGFAEISRRLGETTMPFLSKGEPLPGVYDGIDLIIRAKQWFAARYGRKLLLDLSPGSVALLLRGDVWILKLPVLIGRWHLVATREPPRTDDVVRLDDGRTEVHNVVDGIVGLPEGLRRALTDTELAQLVELFQTAMGAYRALRDCRGEPLIAEVVSDHEATVRHLEGRNAHLGQARWSALQAAEKMFKAHIIAAGRKPLRIHQLDVLSGLVAETGIEPPDPFFIDAVQCDPGVRYGHDCGSLEEAVRAHHASLELTWYLGDELRERRGLSRKGL